jgi:cyanate permease
LLLIVLASMAIRKPFTLQYAREQVSPEYWDRPQFVKTNYIITAVWAAAFAVMVAAEAALVYVPVMPNRLGITVTVLAIVAAVKFTSWYPDRIRSRTA